MYDYYLGGKDNFAADREAAEQVLAAMPNVRDFARANRMFLSRAVTLMAHLGVRQFLDIGSGLPTQENVHQVAHRTAPDASVVYVDKDPVVLTHAKALLADNARTEVFQGDLLDPKGILDHPGVRARLDFDRPVAVLMLAILHFIPGDERVAEIVAAFRERLPSGSYLVISHGHAGRVSKAVENQVRDAYGQTAAGDIVPRPPEQVLRYFDGLELVGSGLVPVENWRPIAEAGRPIVAELPAKPGFLGGVGRVL
jgi:hypothetical protein